MLVNSVIYFFSPLLLLVSSGEEGKVNNPNVADRSAGSNFTALHADCVIWLKLLFCLSFSFQINVRFKYASPPFFFSLQAFVQFSFQRTFPKASLAPDNFHDN